MYDHHVYARQLDEAAFRDAKKELEKQLGDMKHHSFIEREQLCHIRAAKKQAVESHVVMQEHFAKNFNLIVG